MTRTYIPLSDCGLLSRTNARRYCGCLGEERFDREVGPVSRPGCWARRDYARKELGAWIDSSLPQRQPTAAQLLEEFGRKLSEESHGRRRRPKQDTDN
jgi:hypothetical protein